jgi:hypothetical protein
MQSSTNRLHACLLHGLILLQSNEPIMLFLLHSASTSSCTRAGTELCLPWKTMLQSTSKWSHLGSDS